MNIKLGRLLAIQISNKYKHFYVVFGIETKMKCNNPTNIMENNYFLLINFLNLVYDGSWIQKNKLSLSNKNFLFFFILNNLNK